MYIDIEPSYCSRDYSKTAVRSAIMSIPILRGRNAASLHGLLKLFLHLTCNTSSVHVLYSYGIRQQY